MADANTVLSSPPIRRRASYRALPTSMSSRPCPRGVATFFCEPPGEDEHRHFLDACSLCRASLRASRDIFMYKGDTPFCSEECRQVQIELDESREREASSRRRRWHHHAAPSSSVKQATTPVGGQRTTAAEAVVAS